MNMFARIAALLAKLPVGTVKNIGPYLSRELASPFRGATTATLLQEMRAFATTPSKMRTLLVALAGAVGTKEFYDLVEDHDHDGGEGGNASDVMSERERTLAANRAKITGDQRGDTVAGFPAGQFVNIATVLENNTRAIDEMLASCGLTFDAFLRLRNALLAFDDEELVAYANSRRR